MQRHDDKPDAIVVGGGHNGLVGAFYLAKQGLNVLLMDQRAQVGGLCATAEFSPGYSNNFAANSSHNLEPSIVHEMQLMDHGLRFAHPSPSSFMAFPEGRRFIGRESREAMVEELAQLSASDVEGYFETLERMNRLARLLDVSFFAAPPTFAELARRVDGEGDAADRALFGRLMFGSAADLLEERIHSEEVKALLAIVAISGNFLGPSTPGSAYMLFHRPLYRGSTAARSGDHFHTLGTARATPIGGMGQIARAMERAVRAAGVTVWSEARVASIDCIDGQVRGVTLDDGRDVEAPVVLAAVNPKLALASLVREGDLPRFVRDQAVSMKMDGTAFKVLLALEGTPRFRCATSKSENDLLLRCGFRVGGTIAAMDRAYHEAVEGRWSHDPVIWGLVPSAVDPSLCPDGHHVMSLTVFHAPRVLASGSWASERRRFGQRIVDCLADDYIPNLRDLIVDIRCLSPEDLEQEFGLVGAHLSHGDISVAQMFERRPVVGASDYATPIGGLYLGSVGTWPGNYVSGLPGRNAAHRILNDLRRRSKRAIPEELGHEDYDAIEAPYEFGPS